MSGRNSRKLFRAAHSRGRDRVWTVTQEECIALRSRDLFVGTMVPELFCPVMDEFSEPAGYTNEIVCYKLNENYDVSCKNKNGARLELLKMFR